jgi:hypothetical protein
MSKKNLKSIIVTRSKKKELRLQVEEEKVKNYSKLRMTGQDIFPKKWKKNLSQMI